VVRDEAAVVKEAPAIRAQLAARQGEALEARVELAGGSGGGRQGGGRQGGGFGGGQGGFGGGFMRGPAVLRRNLSVRLTVAKEEQTQPIQVSDDSRIKLTDRDRKARYDLHIRALTLFAVFNEAQRNTRTLRTQLTALQGSAGLKDAPQSVKDSVAALSKQVTGVPDTIDGRPTRRRDTGSRGTQPPAPATSSKRRSSERNAAHRHR